MKFSHSFSVLPEDIDEQNHVGNVAFVRWIQDVAVAHWRTSATAEMQAKFTWIIVRHEIDYKKQAFLGEQITATTWVGEPTRISWERFTEIRRGEDLLVRARTVWCLIDRETLKPTRISSDLKELF